MKKPRLAIKTRSNDISSILGDPPKWLSSYSIYMLLAILVSIIVLLLGPEYKESITTKIVLTNNSDIEWRTATTSGIVDFYVVNNQLLLKNDTICSINERYIINSKDSVIISYYIEMTTKEIICGDTICILSSLKRNSLIGYVSLEPMFINQIKKEDKVIIVLNQDKFKELTGTIKNITYIPYSNNYTLEIVLSDSSIYTNMAFQNIIVQHGQIKIFTDSNKLINYILNKKI